MLSTAGLPNLIIKLFGSRHETSEGESVAEATTETTRFAVSYVLKISITVALVIAGTSTLLSPVLNMDDLRYSTILFAVLGAPLSRLIICIRIY